MFSDIGNLTNVTT